MESLGSSEEEEIEKDDDETTRMLDQIQNTNSSENGYPSKTRQIAILVTIIVPLFFSMCVDTVIYPFFPTIAVDKGLSTTEVGVVFAAYDASKFISSLICGSLLTKWHPKSMCATGNFIVAMAIIGFGAANRVENARIFLGLCVLTRLLAGIGSAMLTVAAMSILMKSTSYDSSTIVGLYDATINIGLILGPAVGGVLFQFVGYDYMFWILGAVMISFLPVFLYLVSKVEETTKQKTNMLTLCTIPGCVLIFLHFTILRTTVSARNTGIAEFMAHSFQTSSGLMGALFGSWATTGIIASLIAVKTYNKNYGYPLMTTVWFITAFLFLLIGPSPVLDFVFQGHKYFWLVTITVPIMMILSSWLYIPPFQAALDLLEVNGYQSDTLQTYALVNGLMNSAMSLGNICGPILNGAIVDAANYPWAQTCMAAFNLFMGILMMTYLAYMRLTNQLLALPEDAVTDYIDADSARVRLISDACNDRMNHCLKYSKSLTTSHQVQPDSCPID